MRIFDEILKQYMQNSEYSKQYKSDMQNFFSSVGKNKSNYSIEEKINTKEFRTNLVNNKKNYNDELDSIKDFYNKLEMDARRYNRNFDSRGMERS